MNSIQVRVTSTRIEANRISSFELRPLQDKCLPGFRAGAHIDVHLPSGLTRSYSLCNSPAERHRYVIAVSHAANSRGGSRFMHENVSVGDVLAIGAPRNNFPLVEEAPYTVLIAGGIGITPLWCMVQRLDALDRAWELFYSARSRDSAAFLDGVRKLAERRKRANVHLNFDEVTGEVLDLGKIVAAAPPGAHFYCCGPQPMLAAFERATEALPPAQVHVESFSPRERSIGAGGFTVRLARSDRTLAVAPGETILDVVLNAGIDVPHSCMEGVCGTCETRVLGGMPDHRDVVLSKEEQARGDMMMICCSGAKTPTLVLDL